MTERLQKILADAGVASRRQAEHLIAAGRVSVNNQIVTTPGSQAVAGQDVIAVDGRIIQAEVPVYYALNKPAGYVTTVRDPQRRPTVMHLLEGVTARVYPVGRLDVDAEGLLLFTNDGDLALRLTHPRYGLEKEYVVDLDEPVPATGVDRIRRGIQSEGELLTPVRVSAEGGGRRLRITLAEGRKREVKRMARSVGREVLRLRRVRFGPLHLKGMAPGQWRALNAHEVDQLRAATSA